MKQRLASYFLSLALMAICGACFVATSARAATMVITIGDGPNEGFNDPTPFTPVGGNHATTLGEARLNALKYAADLIGALIDSPVPIEILATMDPLGGSASGNAATLGKGGTAMLVDSFAGAPLPATLYPVALANALAGTDLSPAGNPVGAPSEDIDVVFNSDVDGNFVLGTTHFYYGLDGNPPGQDVDFVTVALHELTHGLGFSAEVDFVNGAVSKISGLDGTYMRNVEHHGANPAMFPAMTDAQRYAAATSGNALHFVGAKTVAAYGGHAELYAPVVADPASAISHFDETALPNELMSPFDSGPNHSLGLALQVLQDIGWKLVVPSGPAVIGPSQLALNTPAYFDIAAVNGATGYEWEIAQRTTTVAPEGGENGTTSWTVSASAGYNVIDTQTAAGGTASMHLAMPEPADQTMTLKRAFRPSNTSQLQFKTWLYCAASGQVARFQISPDDGRTWQDAWTQRGTDTTCSSSQAPAFSLQTVSLAAYAGQRISIRLLYQYSGQGTYFSTTASYAGWHVDDITITNAEEFVNPAVNAAGTNTFTYTPTATGNWTLRARALTANGYTPWGAEKDVLVTTTGPPVRLDVDGSGLSDANDGVMILRRLNGAQTVTTGIVLPTGASNTSVVNAIDNAGAGFDVDGDGDADANDGVMILRRLNGAQTVTTGIVLPMNVGGSGANGERTNAEITTAIDALR